MKPPEDKIRRLYAQVAFKVPLANAYSYIVPERLAGRIAPGKRVEAPFGSRRATGYCVSLSTTPPPTSALLKEIYGVVDSEVLLDAHMLDLGRWMAERYLAGWGEALEAALPAGVRCQTGNRNVLFLARPASEALETAVTWGARAAKRRRALETLVENDGRLSVSALAERAGVSSATVGSLVKLGLAVVRSVPTVRSRRRREPPVRDYRVDFDLTREQSWALRRISAAIDQKAFRPFLLFGVTGSGKTEVYLRAIEKVVRAGGQAVVLVPEISLTPQTVSRFRARFPNIALLHSHLSAGKRHREWRAIASGSADVVIGARSAVFAPAARLGLIVIDEEHENTFKQETSPRYHARDVALRRAEMLSIPVILGTATPSLETFHAAKSGLVERLDLPFRVEGRALPPVEIVDMREERAERKAFTIISRRLEYRMKKALSAGFQVILFLNRRGFATYLTCRRCGWVGKCPQCDITLTFHRSKNLVECHYCDYSARPPTECPECGHPNVRFFGAGTERVVDEVRALFPTASVARMDSDTMKTRHAYTKTLRDFRRGLTDVLVGTQMIVKGLDFPNVTVVGVISADVALNLPDFRAGERTFDLISQVAGRTGRGPAGGVVVVQTITPGHFAIRTAARHDYLSFAERELEHRKDLGYPPVAKMARIILRGSDLEKVKKTAARVRDALGATGVAGVNVLGPAPAFISRLSGRHRYNLIVKAPDRASLSAALDGVRKLVKSTGNVQGVIDIDPLSML
ncbi:MAG: primosomal protein N' [Planctomycetes bacterium]|nr:primosomal protein N' [Planctomycetota bacterium]